MVKKGQLHILFLPSWYPSREHTTIGNFVQRHAFAVSEFHRVTVVSAHESLSPEVEVNELGNLNEIRVYFKKKLPLFSYQKAMQHGVELAKNQFGDFDLSHVHVAYPAGVIALGLDLPFVVTEHFSGYHSRSGFKWGYGRIKITQRILNKAKFILPVSDHLGKAIQEFGGKAFAEKISNVVDTDIFYADSQKPKTFTFLHISTLEERSKNITGILRGFQNLEKAGYNFSLTIGGDGDLEELKVKVQDFGPSSEKVQIVDQQPIDGIAELMRKSHCLVMFSHFENQPCTILEALCSGIPVISSDVGGIPEVLDTSNGILIPAENEELFVKGLAQMIDRYQLFDGKGISEAASKVYSYKAIGQKLSTIYSNVLS